MKVVGIVFGKVTLFFLQVWSFGKILVHAV